MTDLDPKRVAYTNRIRCVGVVGKFPNTGCDVPNSTRLSFGPPLRYSVGPIPTQPDANKSPRCPNCGGLVIEIGRLDQRGKEYSVDDNTFYVMMAAQWEELQKKRDAFMADKPTERLVPASAMLSKRTPDLRITPIPHTGEASCFACEKPTEKHLYLGSMIDDGKSTKVGDTRPICDECRVTLATELLEGLSQ